MSVKDILSGYILRPARSATSNRKYAATATSGVIRHFDQFNWGGSVDTVDLHATQYRCAFIESRRSQDEEYLIWAANNSRLCVSDADEQRLLNSDYFFFGADNTTTITQETATDYCLIQDPKDQAIQTVKNVFLKRGDHQYTTELENNTHYTFSGFTLTLTEEGKNLMGGGVSSQRGDQFLTASYVLQDSKFWWTKNDETLRFGWDNQKQTWRPYKGGAIVNLGRLILDGSYELEPKLSNITIGQYLKGDNTDKKKQATLRVGVLADENSTPLKVLVIADEDVTSEYSWGNEDAILGEKENKLLVNPTFTMANAGKFIWFSYEDFQEDSTGVVGTLLEARETPLFITPIPEITDNPLIRAGSRSYLTGTQCDDEANLDAFVLSDSNSFAWASSTGRLKFHDDLLKLADSTEDSFDVNYLGEKFLYDGISLNTKPISAAKPTQLEKIDDEYYLPLAYTLNGYLYSGMLCAPDGTGKRPSDSLAAEARPEVGLIYNLDWVGDKIFFTKDFAVKNVEMKICDDDLQWGWRIPRGTVQVSLEDSGNGSTVRRFKVKFNSKDKKEIDKAEGEVYFRFGAVTPAKVINKEFRMPSRFKEPYQVKMGDIFSFSIAGVIYVWEEEIGDRSLTAEEAATELNANAKKEDGSTLHYEAFFAVNGRLYMKANEEQNADRTNYMGWLYIRAGGGFGNVKWKDRNLTGCAAFGFNAGWYINAANLSDQCLNDGGLSFGVYRNPYNKDLGKNWADFRESLRLDTSMGKVQENFFFNIDQTPLQDKIGFDKDIFFAIQRKLKLTYLSNWADIVYQFENNRVSWMRDVTTDTIEITSHVGTLRLPHQQIFAEAMIDYFGNGLDVSTGGTLERMTLNEDYLLLDDGESGDVELIEKLGKLDSEGFNGVATGYLFSDFDTLGVSFTGKEGYRIKILGGTLKGSYLIKTVLSSKQVEVYPPFLITDENLTWELHEGKQWSEFDKALVADQVLYEVNHLKEEAFIIKILTGLEPISEGIPAFAIDLSEANASGRELTVRLGAYDETDKDIIPAKLQSLVLGAAANNTYTLPIDLFLNYGSFTLSFGGGNFVYSVDEGNLSLVQYFSSSINGDAVEVGAFGSPIEGQVKFSTTALSLRTGDCTYRSQIYDYSIIGEGEAYYNEGFLYVSEAQLALTPKIYLIEKAKHPEDVVINPIGGALSFVTARKKGQIIEVKYYLADVEGNQELSDGLPTQITERLPVFLRLQPTSKHEDVFIYDFNEVGETILKPEDGGLIQVWSGARLLRENEDYVLGISLTTNLGQIKMLFDAVEGDNPRVTKDSTILVNYQVLEAQGGEMSYSCSNAPIWRPPFRLQESQDTFVLEGDRTEDFVVDGVMLIQGFLLKITSSNYDSNSDSTEIIISPPPAKEIGSLAPAHDPPLLVSGASIYEDAGFWLSLSPITYVSADRGMTKIRFLGNIIEFAKENHVLELGSDVFLIETASLSDDGCHTTIELKCPLSTGYRAENQVPRISARPIFFEGANNFIAGSTVGILDHEVVLFGEKDPHGNVLAGKSLIPQVHYNGNLEEGEVQFNDIFQKGMKKGQRLYFYRVRRRILSPSYVNCEILTPAIKSKYYCAYVRRAGGILKGNYMYKHPDAFFVRVVSNTTYLGEVAEDFAADTSIVGASGSGSAFSNAPENYTEGIIGVRGKYTDTINKDQAARMYIDLYNQIVLAFEQVRESITGGFIGDRDGKFRFEIQRGDDLTPRGYENPYTGILRPRNLFDEWFNRKRGNKGKANLPLEFSDPIWDPTTAFVEDDGNGLVDGDTIDMEVLNEFISTQKSRVRNDIDDVVLVGRGRLRWNFSQGFHHGGIYKIMGDNHALSRLYPEQTNMFMTTFPGTLLGKEGTYGVYTNGREYGEEWFSTHGQQIGEISNPALGKIENISDVVLSKRRARARIVSYHPTGVTVPNSNIATSIPTIIATPLLLSQFPTDAKGNPLVSQLIKGGGEYMDLSTGDRELSTPSFEDTEGMSAGMLSFGKPVGKETNKQRGLVIPTSGIFIFEVIDGCAITFMDSIGRPIYTASELVDVFGNEISLDVGDTIYLGQDTIMEEYADLEDPTQEELEEINKKREDYGWWDVGINEKAGTLYDKSFPSEDDDRFDWQGLLGQTPPKPMQCLEGLTTFYNARQKPTLLPCLKGEDKDDTGDYSIPYLASARTEINVLRKAANGFRLLLGSDAYSQTKSEYPDEIVGRVGSNLDSLGELLPYSVFKDSAVNFLPIVDPTDPNSYVEGSGIANARSYDLFFIEPPADSSLNQSWQGIFSIAELTQDTVSIPRFYSSTQSGWRIQYTIENYMVIECTAAPDDIPENGMCIREVEHSVNVGDWYTILDISSFSSASFKNLKDLFNAQITSGVIPNGNRNALQIKVIDHGSASVEASIKETIDIYHDLDVPMNQNLIKIICAVSGNTATLGAGDTLVDMYDEDPNQFPYPNLVYGVKAIGWFDFSLIGLDPAVHPHGDEDKYMDCAISIDTANKYFEGSGVYAYAGSKTAYIAENRLSFVEPLLDFNTAQGRYFVHKHDPNETMNLVTALYILNTKHEYGFTHTDPDTGMSDGYPYTEINSLLNVNDSTPFTFRAVDEFTPVGTTDGELKVMSFEGHGNDEISIPANRFAALASSDEDGDGTICQGSGWVAEGYFAITSDFGLQNINGNSPSLNPMTITAGSLEKIQKGDVVVVTPPTDSTAITTGTYLVRDVVQPDDSFNIFKEMTETKKMDRTGQLLNLKVPKVNQVDTDNNTITLGNVPIIADANYPTPFPTDGTLYIFINASDVTTGQLLRYEIHYTGDPTVDSVDHERHRQTCTFTIDTTQDVTIEPTGEIKDLIDIANSLTAKKVSGYTKIPFKEPRVGFSDLSYTATPFDYYGLKEVKYFPDIATQTANTPTGTWNTLGTADELIDSSAPASGQLAVFPNTPITEIGTFQTNKMVCYNGNTPSYIQFDPNDFPTLNIRDGVTSGEPCLLNYSYLYVSFQALAGIFVEPSTPKAIQDIDSPNKEVKVVDAGHSMADNNVGLVSIAAFTDEDQYPEGADTFAFSERVEFSVRRIRRFHEVQNPIQGELYKLPFLYETRRATIDSVNEADINSPILTIILTGSFEGMDCRDLNIQNGDKVRILKNGFLVEEHIIRDVGSNTLQLEKALSKGDIADTPQDYTIEVYLRNVIIPHEQSFDQLVEAMTKEEVIRGDDGFVDNRNELKSTTDFSAVLAGDLVIIDPYKDSNGKITGVRPMGDIGVPNRANHEAGLPSELDDNRGFYRVIEVVDANTITVNPVNEFAGTADSPVIFGSNATVNQQFAILPTVTAAFPNQQPSPDGEPEGQNDLRPTATAPFEGNYSSIAPFSYKIIRPTGLFSDEMVDTVLVNRERVLSWINEIQLPIMNNRSGDYYTFQAEEHISELNDPTDPDRGKGTFPNILIESLSGETKISPYLNVQDCLSILGRRFWCGDPRLDYETPESSSYPYPYSSFNLRNDANLVYGSGRPHLVDRIDDILDASDRIRGLRYTWIKYRVSKPKGTLFQAFRAKSTLEEELAEEEEMIDVRKSTEDV